MLAELLRVKQLREADAEKAVRAAQAELAAAQAAVVAAEEAVVRHHEFRLAEEPRLFDQIRGEAVSVARIDEMKQAVALLRETEMNLQGEVETAREAVPPFEAAVRDAEAAHRDAMAATLKFQELVDEAARDEAKAGVAREDAELEEVSEVMFGRGRAGGH